MQIPTITPTPTTLREAARRVRADAHYCDGQTYYDALRRADELERRADELERQRSGTGIHSGSIANDGGERR